MNIGILLGIVAALLLMILWKVVDIAGRLKERFPTRAEQDYDWSQKDPMGHWEAHERSKNKKS